MSPPSVRSSALRSASRVACIGLVAVTVGCGGAHQAVEAPSVAPSTPRPADPLALPILSTPPAPAQLAPYAVNPTIAVSARPGVSLAPVADGADWQRARAALDRGALPDARPEAFVDAVAIDGPGPVLRAEWAASPYRPGYHGLRLVIAPPAGPPPPAAVVVVEARRGLLDPALRGALRGLAGPADTSPGLLIAAEQPLWVTDPGGSADRWTAAVDGLDPAGPADLSAGIAAAEAALPPDGVVIVVAESRVAAPGPINQVSSAGELVDAIRRRPWLRSARLTLEFDARHVERYRLVGFDGGVGPGAAPTLWAGRPTAVLVEIELRADRPPGAIGRMALRGLDGDGRPVERAAAIEPAADDARRVGVALLAAAVAERLRAAWWSRGIAWSQLAADARALKGAPGVERLVPIIDRAAGLDRRADRFADHGAVEAMDPDTVPVLRGAP